MRKITLPWPTRTFMTAVAVGAMAVLSSPVATIAMPAANLSAAVDADQSCSSLVIEVACNGACISKHYRRLMKMRAGGAPVGDEVAWSTARALCGCKP